MKPIITRSLNRSFLLALGPAIGIDWGWICQTPEEHAQGWDRYNERFCTWAGTPAGAWRRWFELTRKNATGMICDALMLPTMRMKNCSVLARKTLGLIEHDRYLLTVDSRQTGGKGST